MSEKVWSFACKDWAQKLELGQTPIPDLPLDKELGDVAVSLFDMLRLPDQPGQPTMGEAAADWCRDIVRAAFGSIDPATGNRMVGEVFNLIPKKNSKTTNAAALGLVAMQMNETPNIDGVIIGPTQAVAEKCFSQAAGMILADPFLEKRFKIVEHQKTIIDLYRDEETGVVRNARLKIKSFDLRVVTGTIPAFAIIDELHVMAKSPDALKVIAQIRGGMITNPESLLVFITTQSDSEPAGVFKSELKYARGVRDGRITNHVRMLPVLYEFPEEIQTSKDKLWRDPKIWPMVLPNLNRPFTLPRLVDAYETEKEKGVEAEAVWASQHLNIQIGLGLHTDRWVGADFWPGAAMAGLTLEQLLELSDVVVCGGDVGGADDLFGWNVLGRHSESRVWLSWSRAWCTEVALTRRKEIAPRLRNFAEQGDLKITETAAEHVTEVADICERIRDAGLFPKENAIGLDPYGVAALLDELDRRGFKDGDVASVKQGYALNGAIKGLERRLLDGTLKHADQPIMDWSVGNAKAETKGNNVYITKQAAGTAKIDPLIALFNAAMLMDYNPVASGMSVYRQRGLLVV